LPVEVSAGFSPRGLCRDYFPGSSGACRLDRTPNSERAYALTIETTLAGIQHVLAGRSPPGFQTPARAYGADFILEIEGVQRFDL